MEEARDPQQVKAEENFFKLFEDYYEKYGNQASLDLISSIYAAMGEAAESSFVGVTEDYVSVFLNGKVGVSREQAGIILNYTLKLITDNGNNYEINPELKH